MVVNIVIAAFMLILIILIWMLYRRVEKMDEDMGLLFQDEFDKVGGLGSCLKSVLKLTGDQLEIMEKMATDIGVIQSQAENIHCQGDNALENTKKILDQMDDITSAASAQDLVTQGMNNLMNFTGMVGGEK